MDEFHRKYFPKTYEEEQLKKARDAYHRHLDICSQCRESPFNQCKVGHDLLMATVPSLIAPKEKTGDAT